MKWFTSSSGRIEFQMTLEQAESASHSGSCDDDVSALCADKAIKAQLGEIDPKVLRTELAEYGCWLEEDGELDDHKENLQRIVWIAAGDISERHLMGMNDDS